MSSEATTIDQFPPLPAIRTAAAASEHEPRSADDDDNEECATPTSDEHKIKPPLTCPPAPRKPRRPPARPRKLGRDGRRFRRVPRDLAAAFDVALPPKKRIRVG